MEKFEGDEGVALVGTDESSHAANGVLVGLKVGNDELLESDNVGREGDEAACPADIGGGSRFGKGRVSRMAVDEHGHGGSDAVSAAFFGSGASGITRFAAERAPAGKDELAQAHDLRRWREGGFAAIGQQIFCWEEVVYTETGFESAGLRAGFTHDFFRSFNTSPGTNRSMRPEFSIIPANNPTLERRLLPKIPAFGRPADAEETAIVCLSLPCCSRHSRYLR
jgi:hypothetical protein